MAEQKPHEGALAGVGDREGHDPHTRAIEATHHLEQLADAVLEEHRELAERREVAAAGRGEAHRAALVLVADAHALASAPSTRAGDSVAAAALPRTAGKE